MRPHTRATRLSRPVPSSSSFSADALISQIVSAHSAPAPRADAPLDAAALGGTMRAVLHDAGFRMLEARWSALELLASRADEDTERAGRTTGPEGQRTILG